MSKAQRLSNWEAETLTAQQQDYAATDAWVCVRILDELLKYEPKGGKFDILSFADNLAEESKTQHKPHRKRHRNRHRHTTEGRQEQVSEGNHQ